MATVEEQQPSTNSVERQIQKLEQQAIEAGKRKEAIIEAREQGEQPSLFFVEHEDGSKTQVDELSYVAQQERHAREQIIPLKHELQLGFNLRARQQMTSKAVLTKMVSEVRTRLKRLQSLHRTLSVQASMVRTTFPGLMDTPFADFTGCYMHEGAPFAHAVAKEIEVTKAAVEYLEEKKAELEA